MRSSTCATASSRARVVIHPACHLCSWEGPMVCVSHLIWSEDSLRPMDYGPVHVCSRGMGRGNGRGVAARFRLVKYYNLPRVIRVIIPLNPKTHSMILVVLDYIIFIRRMQNFLLNPSLKLHIFSSSRILKWQYFTFKSSYLVGGFKLFLFSIIYGIILPID